jgi:BON domain
VHVPHDDRLSATEIFLWTTFGMGAGLVAGFALSEWMGGVSTGRVRGAARRLREGSAARLTTSASVQAVDLALRAEPRLAGLTLVAAPVARGVVELRGWVPNRAARSLAGRVALSAPGIEQVINSVLVRGEDDQGQVPNRRATDQSA